ncbi:LacI family DNA-binding transcriptional regulator [Streptomyces sp. H39-S7]|uniref:LacI family DNA-binding transcriptional regulator n=1 Tax=Streptomyces sp. H39-S7 TaxID=3004357 RepID=UPI0022AF93BC|nr:LacI family DNA-binding transcriptional regulator [Streptomyces sp. H39-S7]MCZ4119762.1 LacI family DNA-binding transcriptional regulator [Streptomyces sp. H39-S7]
MKRSTVGIKDVAEQAGVSLGTVSNVLNRPATVAEPTRRRVLAVIERLGYVRSETARQLRAGRSRMLALLVLDLANPFFAELARGAQQAAREAGLAVMVCTSAGDPSQEAAYLGMFAEQRVRGVLITPTDATRDHLRALRSRGISFVVADRAWSGAEACSVSVDDVAGGRLAVRHLLASGHRRIAYVSGSPHLAQSRDRHQGALDAFDEARVARHSLTVLESRRFDVASGREAGARLLAAADRPTAVFCANDLLALGVLQTLFAAGIRVPDDIALVGYDDIEFAAGAAVPLTSVRQPSFRIGRTAAELLIEETAGRPGAHEHREIVFQPELVVRTSSLGARAGG